MSIAGVIFDCDGVLLESAEIKTQAFAILFEDYPDHVDAIVALHEREGGLSRYVKFDRIYRDILKRPPLNTAERQELGARYSELVLSKVLTCDVVPGARDLLVQLDTIQVPAFVSSGSPHDELLLALRHHGLAPYVERAWGYPVLKPAAIDRVLSMTGAGPDDLLFIGDAWSDLEAARSRSIPFHGRVPDGAANPFPEGTSVSRDIREIAVRFKNRNR